MERSAFISFQQDLARAYAEVCAPLCHELHLTQTAFDILMFLSNNPEYRYACDITQVRHIKANLVSVNVERLVEEGYLERSDAKGDRRKSALSLSAKAEPIARRGEALQDEFLSSLLEGVEDEERQVFLSVLEKIRGNLSRK